MKENKMSHTGRVLIVEGKYDAARLSHLTDAMILLTDGFGTVSYTHLKTGHSAVAAGLPCKAGCCAV